jgi:hypothetical protein
MLSGRRAVGTAIAFLIPAARSKAPAAPLFARVGIYSRADGLTAIKLCPFLAW